MKEQVIVVEACAGSGKTYALAKHYLTLLLSGTDAQRNSLRSILAITFTNKASVEMKERILELLKRIAFDKFQTAGQKQDIISSLNISSEIAAQRALAVMDDILRNYSFFQVQTIDSFINALLLGCSSNIDRSASFKIKRDCGPFLEYCLDMAIDKACQDKQLRTLFEEFLEHYLFVEMRDGWFPKNDILLLIRGLFTMGNNYGRMFKLHDISSRDILRNKAALFKDIKHLAAIAPEGLNQTVRKSLDKFTALPGGVFDLSDLPKKMADDQPPMNKGYVAEESFLRVWHNVHSNIRVLADMEAIAAYNPYVVLFSAVLGLFKELSRKEDLVFLEELNRKARMVFDDEGITVAEVYYRMASRFRYYLIDEFQDTSLLQWSNMEMMVKEALASGGGLFYVGDKKQAIYRFRGGEAGLFDSVKADLAQYPLAVTYLNKNWRSCAQIINFNNRIFSAENIRRFLSEEPVAKELDGCQGAVSQIAALFKGSEQSCRDDMPGGYVEVIRLEDNNLKERDALTKVKLLSLMSDLSQRFELNNIAILCRGNEDVEKVSSWLIENGISIESDKTLNVLEHPLIKELTAFLYFLHSPIDNLNFCAFITGEIFSGAVNIPSDKMRDFIFSLHRDKKLNKDTPAYVLLRAVYEEVWHGYLAEFFKSSGFVSPYELLIAFYARFRVMENFPASQAFFAKFLELVKIKEDECVGMAQILDYFRSPLSEDLYVNPGHCHAVKILTIHKAKGLEFDAVIMPFLRMDISADGTGGIKAHIEDVNADDLKLVRINSAGRNFSPWLQEIYTHDYRDALIDELNGLYVALTRARREMYIIIPRKSGNSINKAGLFITDTAVQFGEPARGTAESKKEDSLNPQVFSFQPWADIFQSEFGDPSSIVRRSYVRQGTILHYALSCIGDMHSESTSQVLKKAAAAAGDRFSLKDITALRKRIEEIVCAKEFHDIFYPPPGSEVFCEKEISNEWGDLKRIDRMVITPKEIIIVDYKSSLRDETAHQAQLREYMQIIRRLYTPKLIKGYLLYLDSLTREEVSIS